MKYLPKSILLLRIVLVVSAVIWPGMCLLTAAGWRYNVENGNYPLIFEVYANWMYTGAGLLLLGTVLCFFGISPRLWMCSAAAAVCSVLGLTAVRIVLEKFTVYADQNFSITDSGQTVSTMFRERILPVWFPALLIILIALWQIFNETAREWRNVRRSEKEKLRNTPAPKILADDE